MAALASFCDTCDEIGVDESGRGTFFGSVYAGAVVWDHTLTADQIPSCLTDSKQMTRAERAYCRTWIEEHTVAYGVGSATALEIDRLNILEATGLAMRRAIQQCQERRGGSSDETPVHLVVDGPRWEGKFGLAGVRSVIGGDGKYYSIAAASVLAKEYHDDHIRALCELHPEWHDQYDLLNNMGYGTPKHIEGLKQYGVTEEHRFSVHIVSTFAG